VGFPVAYVNLEEHRPSLTALQVVVSDAGTLGRLGADFDLRSLPVTSALYQEPGSWRQVKGDPAIRGTLFQQTRTESPMDRNIQNALSILEELLTERGIFQCQIHFSSSQATIWTIDDPLRYRILDISAWYTRHDRIRPMPQYRRPRLRGFWTACRRCG
jgi:hypothetical protein